MARPKRNEAVPNAKKRLETAFWELLEETTIDKISIASLAKRAEVNHNTIYYYYEGGVEELAMKLLAQNVPEQLPGMASGQEKQDRSEILQELMNPENLLRWKRLYLLLNCGSEKLAGQAREWMLDSFCSHRGIDLKGLDSIQQMELDFIFRGYTGILKVLFEKQDASLLVSFLQRPMGQAMLQSIAVLPKENRYP